VATIDTAGVEGNTAPMESTPEKESLLEKFDSAYKSVTLDRRDIYGRPQDTYRRIAAMRAVVDECPDLELREILGMIVTKVVRLVQTPTHLDSWIDIAGYSRCGVMLLDDRESEQAP
jgi:hypothetical protein